MNYIQLYQAIQDYSETTEALFVANIPTFVKQAEERIYNSVQLAVLRKNVTGSFATSNPYLTLPSDWKASFSIAIIDSSGNYNYLLNKDVNYLRAAFPNPNLTGMPTHYALFGSNLSDINTLSLIVAPTPDQNYSTELHYYYYPPTIVQGQIGTFGVITGGTTYPYGIYTNVPVSYVNSNGSGSGATVTVTVSISGVITSVALTNGGQFYNVGDILTVNNSYLGGAGSGLSFPIATVTNASGTSWVGTNFDPALFYGAMREAVLFQRQEQDIVKYYEEKFQEAMAQLKRLGDGLDRGDSYRDGQTKLKVKT